MIEDTVLSFILIVRQDEVWGNHQTRQIPHVKQGPESHFLIKKIVQFINILKTFLKVIRRIKINIPPEALKKFPTKHLKVAPLIKPATKSITMIMQFQ